MPIPDDGGPAFARAGGNWTEPHKEQPSSNRPYSGMTLLDHFAEAAMEGLILAGYSGQDLAKQAYSLGCAMIAERRRLGLSREKEYVNGR
jgi:hypothetical protein